MKGLFGDLFDFNNDGELDSFERAMEWHFVDEMMRAAQEEDDEDDEDDEFV